MYAKEYGSFATFRKDISGRENVYTIPRTGLFSASLNSEILFRGRKPSTQYGAKLALHNTFGDLQYQGLDPNQKERSLKGAAAFFLQLNKYFFILEGGGSASRINAGYRF